MGTCRMGALHYISRMSGHCVIPELIHQAYGDLGTLSFLRSNVGLSVSFDDEEKMHCDDQFRQIDQPFTLSQTTPIRSFTA